MPALTADQIEEVLDAMEDHGRTMRKEIAVLRTELDEARTATDGNHKRPLLALNVSLRRALLAHDQRMNGLRDSLALESAKRWAKQPDQ